MATEALTADVVVVGGGMSGLVTAVRAQEVGADVVLLEKGTRFGGSMYLSGGAIWTYDSMEDIREDIPHGDETLQRIILDSIDEGYEWIEDLDITLKSPEFNLPGSGRQFEPPEFTDRMIEILHEGGGRTLLRTPMEEIRVEDGRVVGVEASTEDGDRLEIDAPSVVLATGGFQGNERLVEQFITEHTGNLWLRANPWSTGDGLLAAEDVGAKTTKGLGRFYGHNLAAPPAEFSNLHFREVSQYYGPHAVALDTDGRRFTDESDSELEETLAQDTAKHAGGRAYYVLDAEVMETTAVAGAAKSDVEAADEHGGRVAAADSLEELGEALSEWGVNGQHAVETLTEYNEAIRGDRGEELQPPRMDLQHTIDSPPFYAVEVQPGITFTMGGLAVDVDMRVLRRSNSTSELDDSYRPQDQREIFSNPIPGLYAAGVDVGNVHYRTYSGGLSQGLVTGRIAGENAAEHAGARG